MEGDSILELAVIADASSGPAVLKVTFTAQASGGTGQGYTYFWDFDRSDGIGVDGFGQEVTYPFGHPGTYTVTVRAWDDAGNYGSRKINVQVEPGNYSPSSSIDIRNVSYPKDNPLIIEGLEITSADGAGIYLANVENVIIRRNWIHGCARDYGAIHIDQCSGITIEENLLEDNLMGIFGACDNASVLYNVIERTSVDKTGHSGIYIAGRGLTNVLIEGNLISHTGPIEEHSNPDLPENVNLPIGVGGYNCVVRGNYVFDSMGSLMAHGDFRDQFYSEEIYIERNVVRNSFPWVEPGIAFCGVKGGRISKNYVDMAWREGIRSYGSRNIEISNNVVLGSCYLIDSDQTSVHHNSIIYNPAEPPEELPHVIPPGSFRILVADVWPEELIQPEGDPAHSEDLLIADNLISGPHNAIHAADCIGIWADWNGVGWWGPDPTGVGNFYLRVVDRSKSAVIGKNNRIASPQFVDPEYGNYLLLVNDPLAAAGHDGGPIGVTWGGESPGPPDISEIIPGISGAELLSNGGAEEGTPDPWWAHTSEIADVRLEAVDSTQFNGQIVTPHSGSYFFLLRGSVTAVDGWGMASAYQEWLPLQADWDDVDTGSAIFVLDGYYWSENDTVPPSILPSVEFYDDNQNMLYFAWGKGLEDWVADSGYHHLTFYGQVPPLARQANVRIMAAFSGYEGEYELGLAFDDVSLRILTDKTTTGIADTEITEPKTFALHQNFPNPFNSFTSIPYDLPNPARVSIKVYNILGQRVKTLVNAEKPAGHHFVIWDGKNEKGQSVSSGIYLYTLKIGRTTLISKRMLLLR